MNTIEAISVIQSNLTEKDNMIKSMEEKNSVLTKVVATVRTNLERAIKGHIALNQAVYDSIDLCRANFKYMDYSSGQIKQDPPLTESDKILA
jgi:sensor domain CHASE-containing protein